MTTRVKYNVYEIYDGDELIFVGRHSAVLRKFHFKRGLNMKHYVEGRLFLDKYTVKIQQGTPPPPKDWVEEMYKRLIYAKENYGVINTVSEKDPSDKLDYLKERGLTCTIRKVKDDGENKKYFWVIECKA